MMQQKNIEALEKYRHLYDSWNTTKTIAYIDQHQKDEIAAIIREEWEATYYPNLWCGPCVADMIVKAFRHLDAYYDSLPKATVKAEDVVKGVKVERAKKKKAE